MISQSGKNTLQRFVSQTKQLLVENVTSLLQQYYGIWRDGHTIPVSQLTSDDVDVIHTARLLRERLKHIKSSLPDETSNKDAASVKQLIEEQAYTTLNRFCALRMCEERDLIMQSVKKGYQSEGFLTYDMVTGQGVLGDQYHRYRMYLQSVFDELSIELPSIFDRYSPYGLIFPDETTLLALLKLLNANEMSAFYDESAHSTINFWLEDETLGWIFQFYNSIEERRQMRDESTKPRNSREMAVRNQFFTPEYVVRFLTDNTLGRIWYEMTNGSDRITEFCKYLVYRKGEEIPQREIKEPMEITTLDPTCGSMHFGIYAYEVYEVIYLDAWDNHPELLQEFRWNSRDDFCKLIPGLILEHNLYGCEIDPRALQMAALSLWLRAQRSYSILGLAREQRPSILKSNLVLAEPMPGNPRLLNDLFGGVNLPMRKLIRRIWDCMKYVGEAGLLIKMEQEISQELDSLHKEWTKINADTGLNLFSNQKEIQEILNLPKLNTQEARDKFFESVMSNLKVALTKITEKLTENEGYDNALFAEDALQGIAFIEMCYRRYSVIVMNPPFGEGSINTANSFDAQYPNWRRNLVCAFIIRMQELLLQDGLIGIIYDRSILLRANYENFRLNHLCGFIKYCADTGWGVLDASVETTSMVLTKSANDCSGVFIDIRDIDSQEKNTTLLNALCELSKGKILENVYDSKSLLFTKLPNSVIGYYFDENILALFQERNLQQRHFTAMVGYKFFSEMHHRLFYEVTEYKNYVFRYGGGTYYLFYTQYRDLAQWIDDGKAAKAIPSFRTSNWEFEGMPGVGYGKRGEIVDAHILKKGLYFTQEGVGLPGLKQIDSLVCLSFINSILSQYVINLYTGQHKLPGYMNLLPMPNYDKEIDTIKKLTNTAISIRRFWFSLDETNLEYHGFIGQIKVTNSIVKATELIQNRINNDFVIYQQIVEKNDTLWMNLANIEEKSLFRSTLNEYKEYRPSEELMSIDGISYQNKLEISIIVEELVMELVGVAFGRWDIDYVVNKKQTPEFGDVFDSLPNMPVVALNGIPDDYPIHLPKDGILTNNGTRNIVDRVRDVMKYIWQDAADDIEYEICRILKITDLQEFFDSPQGFFGHHFIRYTKSRRKAPIYWPLSSPSGNFIVWVYYPKLSENTLPAIVLLLNNEISSSSVELQRALSNGNKSKENKLRSHIMDLQYMVDELNSIIALPYRPNHDDGVPVNASPLRNLFQHRAWRDECESNWQKLKNGEFDWANLAYIIFPERIRNEAKRDMFIALTHGLEELCENKPKQKRSQKKESHNSQTQQIGLSFDNE